MLIEEVSCLYFPLSQLYTLMHRGLPLFCFPLRYMMQWPGGRILQRHELDAFLAQAVSNQLYEPDQLQELKVRHHFNCLFLCS